MVSDLTSSKRFNFVDKLWNMPFQRNQKKKKNATITTLLVSLLLVAFFYIEVSAFVMESDSYRVQSDSLNIGGLRSQSANYFEESTIGELATGISESASYRLKAGYQQMQGVFISMTSVDDITLSPALGGLTGGTSNGGAQFIVKTDNTAGFSVTIKTDSDDGMIGNENAGTIFHLNTATPEVPDFNFNSAPANSSAFAYTINASTTGEIVAAFRNNGSNACNTGSTETDDNCWISATTTPRTIISTTSRTPISGATSTLRFRAIVSANHNPILLPDTYVATTTLTAITL